MWDYNEELQKGVQSGWKNGNLPIMSAANVGQKLSMLSVDLGSWSYKYFCSFQVEIKKLKHELEGLRNVPKG
jgi:hypothetical protein